MQKLISLLFVFFLFYSVAGQTISGTPGFCQGGNTILTVTGAAPGSTYQWQKSIDGGITWNVIPSATNISYTVTAPASYNVIVTNSGNSITTPAFVVIEHPNPVSAFSFSPNNQCGNTPVSFSNTSTGNNLTYAWDFGDPNSGAGNASTNANESHTFIGTPGNGTQNFIVKLTSTDINGCKNSLSNTVTTKQAPGTQLNGSGQTTYNGSTYFTQCSGSPTSTLNLTNNSSTAGTNTFYKIVWGDNSPDFTSSAFSGIQSHTYNTGIYTLLFIVTGGGGCADTATYFVFMGSNPSIGLGNPGNTAICTGSSLTFPITGAATNPVGTTYTVTFNDGSAVLNYSQPPPVDVTHTFNTSSCGITSSGYSNSYSATIRASNPCLTSSATVVPIYVSQKPTANFTISPRDSVCLNTLVTVSNTSLSNYVSGTTCPSGKIVWAITPSAGWTTSGNLGSDNGISDPTLWTTGSNSLNLNFSVPGTYSIKIKTGNPVCGLDSITKTICVNPVPTASFTTDKPDGCAPVTIVATGTTNIPNCGTNKFNWAVSYTSTSGCLPNVSGFSYINGTNANSQNPQFQFNNPGIYTISLTVTSPGGTCTSQVVTKQITIKGKPNISFTSPASLCQGQSFTPVSTVTCYTAMNSYIWSFPGGTPSSSTSANPGSIIYSTSGSYNISLDVTNECGTTNVTKPIVISAAPSTPVAGSNSPLCSGASLNLTSSSATVGVTYAWTGPGGYTSNSQNPVRANTTVAMSGNYNVTATINGCASSPSTVSVTINQTPATPVVTTPVNYCLNTIALPLIANATAGNSLLWYTTSSGGTGSATTPVPLTSAIGTTTYYVSQINSTATCESGRVAIVVNVGSIPSIVGNSTDPTTCTSANGTITLSGLTASTTYNVLYTKNGGTPTSINLVANSSGVITIANLSAGSYTNISAAFNGCPSNIVGPFTLVDPSAPAATSASSNGVLCSGNTLNLFSTTGPAGATYSWSGPAGFTSALQNPSRLNTTTAMAGTYNVVVTLNGCTSLPGTVNVIINQTPALPTVTTPVNFCQGDLPVPLIATGSPGNTLNWYNVASGGTAVTTAPTPVTSTIGTTTYYVSQINISTNCESSRTPIIVNVNAIPVINGNATDPSSCSTTDGQITLTGLTLNTLYVVKYTKNGGVPTSINLTSNNNGVITITNLSAGTYTNISASFQGCLSNSVGPFTLVNPSAPAAPTAGSNSPFCSGGILNLTASVAPPGATYAWTGPGGFTSILQNPQIANTTTAMSGVYNVALVSNGCTSAPAAVNVVINNTPSVPAITTPINYCQGATALALSASSSPGNSLLWYSVASGGTGSNTAPVPSTSLTGSTNYFVSQLNSTATCESGRAAISVIVGSIPSINGNSTNPSTCTASNGTIKLTGLVSGTSYNVQYTKNGGTPVILNLVANNSGVVSIINLSSGTYTNIGVDLNGCPSNTIGPFVLIDPSAPATPTAKSNSPLCSGNNLNLTSSQGPAGAVYTWTGPGGFTSALQNPVRTNATIGMNGTYSVIVSLNGCSSLSGAVDVQIGESPIVSLGPDLILGYGTQQQLISAIQNGPVSSYLWTPANNLNCTNCASPVADIKTGISYVLKATNIYGCSASDTINIKVICEKSQVYIPNAFTPDGDGVNDIFMIRGSGPISIKSFRIFTRWGELIFEKSNFQPNSSSYGWDGKVKGVAGPSDVFVYTAEIICDNGSSFIYKGNVTLVK